MKTIAEINRRIANGSVVVLTAEEMVRLVRTEGPAAAARTVDVVTTGTFGPMCSSGVYLNLGHSRPRIKAGGGSCTINNVPCYTGFAAVDVMLGATALPDDDPRNRDHPGEFRYGGGHVIHDLVAGREVTLTVRGYGTDCYPRRELTTRIKLSQVNEAVLFNPRNAYQNYNVAVNLSDRTLYTYLGVLRPNMGNANYCSAGQLSPLLKDPHYRTIGVGTRIFLGGGIGYVAWSGTQHNPSAPRTETGIPKAPAGTLAVIGDLKQMKPEYLVGCSMIGYGPSLMVGVGIPIPILDEEMARTAGAGDDEIVAPVVDYSNDYPNMTGRTLGWVNYRDLRSGSVVIQGKTVPTGSLSSYARARHIAGTLKSWIASGSFTLTEAVMKLPDTGSGVKIRTLEERTAHAA